MSVIEIDYNCIVDENNELRDYARPVIKALKDVGYLIVVSTKQDPEWIKDYLTYAMIPCSSVNYRELEFECILGVSKITNTEDFNWQMVVSHYSSIESAGELFKTRYKHNMIHEPVFRCPQIHDPSEISLR